MKIPGARLFITVIAMEVALVAILLLVIVSKSRSHSVFVNRVDSESVKRNPASSLKYFFEPKPNVPSITDPLITWTKAVGLRNDEGLNERYDYQTTKDPGVFRIITLGDSYTAGLGVNTEENYTERLEDKLNAEKGCKGVKKFEVINLGVSGYDLQYAVERFRIRGQKYRPDLVLWFFKDDDFYEINEIIKKNEQQITNEMMESGEWDRLLAQGKMYPPSDKIDENILKSHTELGDDAILRMQTGNLKKIREYYQGLLLLVTFPSTKSEYRSVASSFASSDKKVLFTDSLTDINKYQEEMTFYPYDMHPNKKGHEVISDDILKFLKEKNVIGCD